MTNWKEYKLGELIETVSKTFKFSDKKVVFLNTSDTLEGKVINHNLFEPKKLPGQAKKTIQPNDILYSEIRPANKRYAFVNFDSSNYVVSTKLMVLRVLDKEIISPKYLYYFLTSDEIVSYLQMLAESRSGTFPQIRFEEVSLLDIKLPPLNVQNEIVELVASLDDKIELNNKINQELENLAQTLFKQWFIDFEFPNEKGEPYKSSGGALVDSELGEIPKGWEVGTFGDLCKVVNGYAFKSKDFSETGSNGILKIRNVNGSIVDILNTQFVSSDVVASVQEKFRVLTGHILIAMTGAEVGKTGIVPETNKSLWLNQRVGRFEPIIENTIVFIYHMFNVLNFTQAVRNSAMGSAQPNISASGIESLNCIIPFKEIILLFSSINQDSFNLILKHLGENQELTHLRDTLLPKLISGELEVADVMAEKA